MTFVFFTLGGRQLWEDVFYYQKWRIQRNCLTKHYRLLDNWDIRRASGSFAECQRAFERCRNIFQLTPPVERGVLLLHGLGGNKNQFRRMARNLEAAGLTVIAVNYPSTRKSLQGHVRQLEALLLNLPDIHELSFISAGIGGLLVRLLLSNDSPWRQNIKIGKVIQINPPNRGYPLWEKWEDNPLAKLIFGASIRAGNAKYAAKIPTFQKDIDFGIINTHNRPGEMLQEALPTAVRRLFPRSADSYLPGMKDVAEIRTWHANPLADKETILACRNFLRTGKFRATKK